MYIKVFLAYIHCNLSYPVYLFSEPDWFPLLIPFFSFGKNVECSLINISALLYEYERAQVGANPRTLKQMAAYSREEGRVFVL